MVFIMENGFIYFFPHLSSETQRILRREPQLVTDITPSIVEATLFVRVNTVNIYQCENEL